MYLVHLRGAMTWGPLMQEDGHPEVLRRRPRHHMESEHHLTARQRARLADLSLLLDKVLATKNLTKQKELLRRGLLSQLQFCAVNNYGTGYKSALLKILRAVEALPLYGPDVHARRSAHGSFGDVLVDLAANAADRAVRERARSLLQRFPPPPGAAATAPLPRSSSNAAAADSRRSTRGSDRGNERSSAPAASDSGRGAQHSSKEGRSAAAQPPPLRLGPPPPTLREPAIARQVSGISARQAKDATSSPRDLHRAPAKRSGGCTPDPSASPAANAAALEPWAPQPFVTGTVTRGPDGELYTTSRPWWAMSAARSGYDAAVQRMQAVSAAGPCSAAVLGVQADVAQGLQLGLYRSSEFALRRPYRQ